MKFRGTPDFEHGKQAKIGILVTNLGTPEAATPNAVRHYLAEFLSDPRVVEFPRLLWKIVLHGIILRIRPNKVAHAYQTVWTPEGSPLLVISRKQASALAQEFSTRHPDKIVVELAMRYGSPSISHALRKLHAAQIDRLLILPLYPQYSATTTASTFDAISHELNTWRFIPELRMITSYHDFPAYINALANSIETYWSQHGKPHRLLISFHGIPKRYLMNGDPYYCQCQKTTRLLVERLQLTQDQYAIAFQSRFGREPWLQPYADITLLDWAKQGITEVDVVCPGFSADCLETLEEIAMQNKCAFLAAGGKEFRYIAALNDEPEHIHALADLAQGHLGNWLQKQEDEQENNSLAQPVLESTKIRARALGAKM